jgi:signal transduction histidine kinase
MAQAVSRRPRVLRREARGQQRRPPLLRSIRTRLAAIFFLITLLAVAVIYVIIAPPLTTSLQNEKIDTLKNLATPQITSNKTHLADEHVQDPPLPSETIAHVHSFAVVAANATQSTVNVFDVEQVPTGTQSPQAHIVTSYPSDANTTSDTLGFAENVVLNDVPQDQPYTGASFGLAMVGFPVKTSGSLTRVVVFSQLNDVGGAVSFVRSRILEAAAVALLVALLTGVFVARALTVRLLRLERTAQRVAIGDFDAHFADASGDELGRLARALAHMQSQLEGLEDARRRFIATASHELRTPIFSLGGFLELIQDEDLDDETRRAFVGQVREQVERLGKLATQLLDLSRLESGSVQLEPAPTDLGVLARAVSSEFVPAAAQHGSQLELDIPDNPVRVMVDPDRVAQLLRILVDNALVHTGAGTAVTVTISPPAEPDGASLSVHDQGAGIPDEALARIFEPFYGADGARGAGLGLAIAHELAAQMGARLEVASAPGDTTFLLVLPGEDG